MAHFFRQLKQLPKRLLITRTDRIGDVILSLPVFEVLKQELDLHVSVLCQAFTAPLFNNNPYVDDLISISRAESIESQQSIILSKGYDAILVLVNDKTMLHLLPRLKQIPCRIGPLSKPSALFHYTHPVRQKRSMSTQNEAAYNLELLKIFGIDPPTSIKPRLYLNEVEIQAFRSKHGELYGQIPHKHHWIAIHPGMGGSALNMSFQFYLEVMSGLVSKGFVLFLTGSGKAETANNDHLIHQLKTEYQPFVVNVSDRFDLRELAILLSESRLFIGPSTGPTHLANAVDTPVFSFYPPITVQSATRWGPFGYSGRLFTPDVDCGLKYRCIEEKCPHFYCMDQISAESVLEQVQQYLQDA